MAFECVIVKEEPNLKEDGDNEVSSETASQNGADAEKKIIKVEIEVEAPAVRIKPEPLDPPTSSPRSPSDPSWHAPCQEGSTVPAAEEVTNILPEKYIHVSIKEEVDSDDITDASTVEEHAIVVDPDVGQTSTEPIVTAIDNENESMTSTRKAQESKRKRVDMDCGTKTLKKRKFRNEDGLQAIIKRNLDFKKRQLALLEVEHSNKVEIQKLKIRKLQLELALLEHS